MCLTLDNSSPTNYIPPMDTANRPEDAIIALTSAIREQGNVFVQEALERQGIHDLLPAHGAVLHALFVESPLRMQELARRIGRKKNTVTGLINTLETHGYCRRESVAHDGRGQLVALTDKGQAMRQTQVEVSRSLFEAAWAGVPVAERRACAATLERVLANLRAANVMA